MRTLKILTAFQGTHYSGWQSQKSGKAIQDVFEKHLAKILKHKVSVCGCSRTDAGVHARAFVAHFKTKNRLPEHRLKNALNHYLPRDIVVLSVKKASNSFHARFSAKSKTYQYEIWNQPTRPPYDKHHWVLWVAQKLNVTRMRKASKYFLGRHDFNAFRDSGDAQRRTVKTIHQLVLNARGSRIIFRITGDGFLKHMIRVIIGTLMEVGRGKISPELIPSILDAKDRRHAGPTAKAQGLTLSRVHY